MDTFGIKLFLTLRFEYKSNNQIKLLCRSNTVLFSTDVCAMGTHCPTLNIGVSLGR